MTVLNEILMTVVNVHILRESSPGETSTPTPQTLPCNIKIELHKCVVYYF